MKSKEEQKKIIYRLAIVVILALVLGLACMTIENMVLAIIIEIIGIVYIFKLSKATKNIHKNLQEFYPNEFYNIKEPTHLEITSYLKANDFTLLSKGDMIYAVKYYKTKTKIITNHNMLSMLFLQKDDTHFVAGKYGDELKEFTKEINERFKLKNKNVVSIYVNVLLLDGEPKKKETGDMSNMIVAYNRNDKMLYYKSYLKYLYSPIAGFMIQEVDKHISDIFKI